MPRHSRRVRFALCCAPLALIASTSPNAAAIITQRAATGRIEGQVLISTALTARRPRFRIYADPGPGSRPPARVVDEMRNVVIYLQHAIVPTGIEPARASIAQDGEQFLPHIVPVFRGATVEFLNNDDIYHNVFSLSSAKTFDLGRYPKGSSRSVLFDRPGTVQVFCHIHSDMSAIVLVLDNPFFGVPSDAGHYAIDGIPPGDYVVMGWHERIKPVSRTIHVAAGETTRLDFNIPVALPGENAGH